LKNCMTANFVFLPLSTFRPFLASGWKKWEEWNKTCSKELLKYEKMMDSVFQKKIVQIFQLKRGIKNTIRAFIARACH
jgi:hypothetical protein